MQGVLVVAVPVLIAAFALLMDRFEARVLMRPAPADTPSKTPDAR